MTHLVPDMPCRTRAVWIGVSLGMAVVVGLAMLPPFLSETARGVVMQVFAPLCHQIPERSPHVGGVAAAICDRCTGIYVGLLLGTVVAGFVRRSWRRLDDNMRYVLLGSLVPLGIDWAGHAVGLWTNTPVSRALTGAVFGIIAGLYVTDSLLRSTTRAVEREAKRQA